MTTISSTTCFKFNIFPVQHQPTNTNLLKFVNTNLSSPLQCFRFSNPKKCSSKFVCSAANNSDFNDNASQESTVSAAVPKDDDFPNLGDVYMPLFIRMLGMDHDPCDREMAVIAVWKYSLGGKHYVDKIMQSRGCIKNAVHLLRFDSNHVREAAAGLLRMISSVDSYRDIVAASGAIEEATALLMRSSLSPEVKEQCLCLLWNISVDEKYRMKIVNGLLLPSLVKFLDDEDTKIIEAAGGVLVNLALSPCTHKDLVEAEVIPKMAKFITGEVEASKVTKTEAKSVLLQLAKDDYYKILIMEQGLVLVPLVGAETYASYRPGLYSWPSLPDGSEFKRNSKVPSRYGASELLLGLNVEENTDNVDESKIDAMIGRTQQQFLARVGAIESENKKEQSSSGLDKTLLPWKDGIARLVLILELEDETSVARAAEAIATASISEHARNSFREAGAVRRLVHLLNYRSDRVCSSVMHALEKLSISNALCKTMEAEGVTKTLIDMLRDNKTTENLMENVLSVLARILDPNKEMNLKKVHDSGSDSNTSDLGGNMVEMKDMIDSTLVAHLINILKTAPSSSQAKVASILEFAIMFEPSLVTIVSDHLGTTLLTIFEQKVKQNIGGDEEDEEPDPAYVEETGIVISATSRLLTKLLDYQDFCVTIKNSTQFIELLRKYLKSDIPLCYKDRVAACLIKLSSLFGPPFDSEKASTEIILYETIPRLIDQIKTSSDDDDALEAAVVELNRMISKGLMEGATQIVVAYGGILPLVNLLESRNVRLVEAVLSVLYNLSLDSENHSEILAAGVVPILTRIVAFERPNWMQALHLMRKLPV